MDYVALKAELDTDPLTRGYAGFTDEQVVTSLNTPDRVVDREFMSASEIFEAIEVADYTALTDPERTKVQAVLGLGDQIAIGTGTKARAFLVDAFGGTTTATNLSSISTETVSRATEIGLGNVSLGDVQNARAL